MASEDEGFSEATEGEGERLTRIEDRLDALAAAIARLVPGSHAEAQKRTEDRLDRPSTVEEQVRAELEKRDRQAAEQRDREDTKQELADLRAKLTEVKPEPPESRATRLMWGSTRGR